MDLSNKQLPMTMEGYVINIHVHIIIRIAVANLAGIFILYSPLTTLYLKISGTEYTIQAVINNADTQTSQKIGA
jgi:hypothetical protein